MSEIQQFSFDDLPVRILDQDGAPWFVLSDVCAVLGISKYRDAATRLDEDERGSVLVDTLGGPQDVSTVNESGLYSLIFRSRKPVAKRFKKWVTAEVLPTLRTTGRYEMLWARDTDGPQPLPLPPPGAEDHSHLRASERFDRECRRLGFDGGEDFARQACWNGAKRRYYLERDGTPKKPEDFHLLVAWRFDLAYLIWGRRDAAPPA
jgi:hypothetical protein